MKKAITKNCMARGINKLSDTYQKSTKKVKREGVRFTRKLDNLELTWKDVIKITNAVNKYCKERVKRVV